MNSNIEIKQIPELNLAGVKHIGINGIENAFEKLIKWAIPKGLLQNAETKMGRIFYDSFKVTAPDKIRMSVFLTTNVPFEIDGEINKLVINKGKCIVGHFEIYHNDFREHPENKFRVDCIYHYKNSLLI